MDEKEALCEICKKAIKNNMPPMCTECIFTFRVRSHSKKKNKGKDSVLWRKRV